MEMAEMFQWILGQAFCLSCEGLNLRGLYFGPHFTNEEMGTERLCGLSKITHMWSVYFQAL